MGKTKREGQPRGVDQKILDAQAMAEDQERRKKAQQLAAGGPPRPPQKSVIATSNEAGVSEDGLSIGSLHTKLKEVLSAIEKNGITNEDDRKKLHKERDKLIEKINKLDSNNSVKPESKRTRAKKTKVEPAYDAPIGPPTWEEFREQEAKRVDGVWNSRTTEERKALNDVYVEKLKEEDEKRRAQKKEGRIVEGSDKETTKQVLRDTAAVVTDAKQQLEKAAPAPADMGVAREHTKKFVAGVDAAVHEFETVVGSSTAYTNEDWEKAKAWANSSNEVVAKENDQKSIPVSVSTKETSQDFFAATDALAARQNNSDTKEKDTVSQADRSESVVAEDDRLKSNPVPSKESGEYALNQSKEEDQQNNPVEAQENSPEAQKVEPQTQKVEQNWGNQEDQRVERIEESRGVFGAIYGAASAFVSFPKKSYEVFKEKIWGSATHGVLGDRTRILLDQVQIARKKGFFVGTLKQLEVKEGKLNRQIDELDRQITENNKKDAALEKKQGWSFDATLSAYYQNANDRRKASLEKLTKQKKEITTKIKVIKDKVQQHEVNISDTADKVTHSIDRKLKPIEENRQRLEKGVQDFDDAIKTHEEYVERLNVLIGERETQYAESMGVSRAMYRKDLGVLRGQLVALQKKLAKFRGDRNTIVAEQNDINQKIDGWKKLRNEFTNLHQNTLKVGIRKRSTENPQEIISNID